MRTTITLDPDVVAQLERLRSEHGLTFKEAVNSALRRGLAVDPAAKPDRYVMPTRDLGMKESIDIDRIRDALSAIDDARFTP